MTGMQTGPTGTAFIICKHSSTVTPMSDELVRADPVVRRRALAILLGAAVAGAAVIQWGLPWLELARLRQPGMQRTICITFLGVLVALALAVIGSGRRLTGLGG